MSTTSTKSGTSKANGVNEAIYGTEELQNLFMKVRYLLSPDEHSELNEKYCSLFCLRCAFLCECAYTYY